MLLVDLGTKIFLFYVVIVNISQNCRHYPSLAPPLRGILDPPLLTFPQIEIENKIERAQFQSVITVAIVVMQ